MGSEMCIRDSPWHWTAPAQYSRCTASKAVATVQHQRNLHRLIYMGTHVFILFNLRHPRHFKSTNIPKGTLYIYMVAEAEHNEYKNDVIEERDRCP